MTSSPSVSGAPDRQVHAALLPLLGLKYAQSPNGGAGRPRGMPPLGQPARVTDC